MPAKPTVLSFSEETYGARWHLLYPATTQDTEAFLRKQYGIDFKVKPSRGRCMKLVDEEDYTEYVISLSSFSQRNSTDIATLTHELFHLVEYVLQRAGVKHNKHTSEAYAYLLDTFVRAALDRISGASKKKKSLRK